MLKITRLVDEKIAKKKIELINKIHYALCKKHCKKKEKTHLKNLIKRPQKVITKDRSIIPSKKFITLTRSKFGYVH